MKPLTALRQRRFELQTEGKKLADRIEAMTATPQEEVRAAEIMREVADLDVKIAEMEEAKRLEMEEELNPPKRTGGGTGARYADMFGPTSNAGFKGFAEFASAMHAGYWHPSFSALMTSGDGSGTGLMIPTQYAAELWDKSLEGEVVRPRARIEPMTSDTKTIAGLSHGDGTDAPFGISGAWTAAGETITPDNAAVRSITLTAKKLAAMVQVSAEAAADGDSIDAQLSSALTRGLGWLLDVAFLTGTGAGEPLGILNAPCTVTVSKETDQVADTVVYENVVKMAGRLHPACWNNAVWIANIGLIPQLLMLTIDVGTGGSHYPVLKEDSGMFSMLTRPVIFTEKLPQAGDLGDIVLADLSQYVVGLRQEVILEKSTQVGFTTDTVYYRAKVRADGQPLWDQAYTPKAGSSLSPFVILEAR